MMWEDVRPGDLIIIKHCQGRLPTEKWLITEVEQKVDRVELTFLYKKSLYTHEQIAGRMISMCFRSHRVEIFRSGQKILNAHDRISWVMG